MILPASSITELPTVPVWSVEINLQIIPASSIAELQTVPVWSVDFNGRSSPRAPLQSFKRSQYEALMRLQIIPASSITELPTVQIPIIPASSITELQTVPVWSVDYNGRSSPWVPLQSCKRSQYEALITMADHPREFHYRAANGPSMKRWIQNADHPREFHYRAANGRSRYEALSSKHAPQSCTGSKIC